MAHKTKYIKTKMITLMRLGCGGDENYDEDVDTDDDDGD